MIEPIIAAIVGESNFATMGFEVGDAFLSIGLVIQAIINFVIVRVHPVPGREGVQLDGQPDAEAGPTEIDLLTEIRDSLATAEHPLRVAGR